MGPRSLCRDDLRCSGNTVSTAGGRAGPEDDLQKLSDTASLSGLPLRGRGREGQRSETVARQLTIRNYSRIAVFKMLWLIKR